MKPIAQFLPFDPRCHSESPAIGQDEADSAPATLETHVFPGFESSPRASPGQGVEREQIPPIPLDRNDIDDLDFVG